MPPSRTKSFFNTCIYPLPEPKVFYRLLSHRFYCFINQYLNTIVARYFWSGVYVSEVMFLTVELRPSYARKTLACAEQVQVNLSVTSGTTGRPKAVFVVTYHNGKKYAYCFNQFLIEDSLVQSLGRSPLHSCLPRFHSSLFVLAHTNRNLGTS